MYKKENIKKDFWKIFFPLLLIFYIFIAYNLVDVYFAGLISEKAIAGLQIAYPMFFLLLAFNEAVGTALNNLTSISLGEKKEKNIAKYFTIGTIFSVIIGLIFFIFSENIINLFITFSSNKDLEVISFAKKYATVLFNYSVLYIFGGMIWQLLIVFKKRKAQIFMATTILVMNIILDYIFVKYLSYGVSGIAYATVITWGFTAIFGLYYVLLRQKITNFTKNIKLKNFKKFLSFANSTFFVMFLVMGTIIVDNYFFGKIGTEALISYGIGSKLKDLVFYPIIGGSIAFSVLYGYFYGKKDKKTLEKIISYVIKIGVIYSVVLLMIMPLIGKIFGGFFTTNELTLKYLLFYMFFSSLSMFGFVFEFLYSSILQITSHHKARIILNIIFLIFVFIFEYIFYEIFKTYVGIWIGAVIASLSVSYLTYLYYRIKVRK